MTARMLAWKQLFIQRVDTNDVETTFKVTGHIVVSDSDEATVEFNGTIPAFKWATLEEFLQAAKDNSTDV